MTYDDLCDFCYAISTEVDFGNTPDFITRCGRGQSRVFWKSANSFAMIALGPLTIGNAVIVPHRHYRSISEMPLEEIEALSMDLESIMRLIEQRTGLPVVVFEHGMPSVPSEIDSCIDHVHLQMIPTEVDILAEIKHRLTLSGPIESIEELSRYNGEVPYLYISQPSELRGKVFLDQGIPSQYVRRVYAEAVNDSHGWNWRSHPRCEVISKSMQILGPFPGTVGG